MMKPRDSIPTTLEIAWPLWRLTIWSMVLRSPTGSLSSVVMSRNMIPWWG
jgi:hypothetical protein